MSFGHTSDTMWYCTPPRWAPTSFLCIAFLLSSAFLAPSASIAQQTSTIVGTIVNGSGGEPIPDARLELGAREGPAPTRYASSGPEGRFRFDYIPPGDYTLTAQVLGFQPHQLSLTLAPGGVAQVAVELEAENNPATRAMPPTSDAQRDTLTGAGAAGDEQRPVIHSIPPSPAPLPSGFAPGLHVGLKGGASAYLGAGQQPGVSTLGRAYAAELTYQFNPVLGLGLAHHVAEHAGPEGSTTRYGATHLSLRLARRARRVAPYVLFGVQATFGEHLGSYGAHVGGGLDWKLSPRVSFFQEVTLGSVRAERAEADARWGGLGSLGLGLRVNLFRRYKRATVVAVTHPDTLWRNQPITFLADVPPRAAQPVRYRWNFGDGTIAEGNPVNHRFIRPGPHQIVVTTTNRGGQDRAELALEVHDRTRQEQAAQEARRATEGDRRAARVVQVYGKRTLPVGEAENFRVRLGRGVVRPVNFRWDMGDGTQAEGNNVVHRYQQPGLYTVTVEARNAFGTTTYELFVTVPPPAEQQPSGAGVASAAQVDTTAEQEPAAGRAARSQPSPGSALWSSEGIDWAKGGYTLLVATRLDQRVAERDALHYRREGYRTGIMVDDTGPGSTAYRVVVGQFATMDQAGNALKALTARDQYGSVIPIEQ